jgi:hypothetical protein
LLDPYDVIPSSDGLSYTFTNKFGIKFILTFFEQPIGTFIAYSFSIYPQGDNNEFDPRIKITVIKVISDILRKEENLLFYVCDSTDDNSCKRNMVFNYWFEKEKTNHTHVEKYDYSVDTIHGYTINSSLLYNVNNVNYSIIIDEFNKEIELGS